jgi:hypothetical protein
MAAGRADRIAGGDDPRALQPAAVHGFAEADVLEAVGTDVSNGGEAGAKGLLGIGGSNRRPEAVGILEASIAADLGQRGQMDVHVDQARKQGLARQVDPFRPGGDIGPGAAAADHRGDAAVGDHHHRLLDDPAGEDVDHPVGGDDDGFGRGGRGGGGSEEEGGEQGFAHRVGSGAGVAKERSGRQSLVTVTHSPAPCSGRM